MLALLLAACQSTNRLREAQDSFNAAAALENSAQLEPLFGKPGLEAQLQKPAQNALADLSTARSGYAAALLSLKRIAGKDLDQLKADKLWGAALALQALTEWRLGKYDDALHTADDAASKAGDQLYPRDAAVLTALPGLIKIDLAYDRIAAMTNGSPANSNLLTEVARRLVGVPGEKDESAVKDLQEARKKAGPTHPVNLYLMQAQLAAFRNYQVAFKRTHDANPDSNDPAKKEAQNNLFELQDLLKKLAAGPAGDSIVSSWKDAYNIIPIQRQ